MVPDATFVTGASSALILTIQSLRHNSIPQLPSNTTSKMNGPSPCYHSLSEAYSSEFLREVERIMANWDIIS